MHQKPNQNQDHRLDHNIFALLADKGSLTDRFKLLMGVTPHLTLLSQRHSLLSWQERQILDIKPRQMALIREIKMGNGEKNWLFARTTIPLGTLKGSAKRLSHLKEKPIGKVLFGRHGAKRTQMQISLAEELPNTLKEFGIDSELPLWQRRSIFEFASGPLMINEIFLPDCPFYDSGRVIESKHATKNDFNHDE